ncbi:alkaline phosphatase D family protein [Spongiivirga sp. MCCC 1A20706]|uniref:alkaline phosphatase D family protein n=1 Tax=Spongiivirga sp. MCCC 1A20706 TaxID=3160963 RepID=UPI0039779071
MAQLVVGNEVLPFDPALKPFYHGVASGDPLADRVIIWTRVTTEEEGDVNVSYKIATDLEFKNIIRSGKTTTNSEKDYTVKIDVTGLHPETTYYYYFSSLGKNSIIGRTRTSPIAKANYLRFGVVAAANYQAGYFNAYSQLAKRKDLDAVIHLGDYINEYGAGNNTEGYSKERADRINIPNTELLDIADYRTRYSLYRLDPDLQAVHQQHPFIAIWDDHESAYQAYKDGATNHNKNEGAWETRKSISKKVFFEWMPIRETKKHQIYRTLSYGNLADIILLDTRLEGRQKQIFDINSKALHADDRTILGSQQKAWLKQELLASNAKWKIIGSQVLFSDFNIGWAANQLKTTPNKLESAFLDHWDGYPAERKEIINFFTQNSINNTVLLSGDMHSSLGLELENNGKHFGVEFSTPSISSANFNELDGTTNARYIDANLSANNEHLKFSNVQQHGYMILNVRSNSVQADWVYTDITEKPDYRKKNIKETYGESWFANFNDNKLQKAASASNTKPNQPALAPSKSPAFERNKQFYKNLSEVMSVHQNTSDGNSKLLVQHVAYEPQHLVLDIYDQNGKTASDSIQKEISSGIQLTEIALPKLKKGSYFIRVSTEDAQHIQKVQID